MFLAVHPRETAFSQAKTEVWTELQFAKFENILGYDQKVFLGEGVAVKGA